MESAENKKRESDQIVTDNNTLEIVDNTTVETKEEKQTKEEAPTQKKGSDFGTFPNWIDLLAMLGLFFLTQTIVTLVFVSMGWSATLPDNFAELSIELQREAESVAGRTTLLWSLISLPLMLIMVMVYRSVRNGQYGSVRHSLNGFNPTILLWGVMMLLSVVVLMEPLLEIMPDIEMPQGRGLSMLTALVIVAPVFEELLCRGVILEALRTKYGAAIACFVSALFFAIMHLEPQAMVNAFVMGLLLGYIYLRTNSIFAPIILHAINNLFAYMFLVFNLNDKSLMEMIQNPMIYRFVYGIAIGIMLLSLIGITNYVVNLQKSDKAKKAAAAK
ncbi:MAG: type II CAAX endopeptidase family protein [Rikenellaceae bacterium]